MKADNDTPELFTCSCGGVMWKDCGVVSGQRLDESLLTCGECGTDKKVKRDRVEKVMDNW